MIAVELNESVNNDAAFSVSKLNLPSSAGNIDDIGFTAIRKTDTRNASSIHSSIGEKEI